MHFRATVRDSRFRTANISLLGLILLATVGCGSGIEMGTIAGTVTLDGKPMTFGTVMMQHVEGGQPSRGEIQSDGSFVLSTFQPEDGARVGTNRVRITAYSTQDPARSNGLSGSGALGVLVIPEKYASFGRSGLTTEVAPGDNPPLTFELTTKSTKRR